MGADSGEQSEFDSGGRDTPSHGRQRARQPVRVVASSPRAGRRVVRAVPGLGRPPGPWGRWGLSSRLRAGLLRALPVHQPTTRCSAPAWLRGGHGAVRPARGDRADSVVPVADAALAGRIMRVLVRVGPRPRRARVGARGSSRRAVFVVVLDVLVSWSTWCVRACVAVAVLVRVRVAASGLQRLRGPADITAELRAITPSARIAKGWQHKGTARCLPFAAGQ